MSFFKKWKQGWLGFLVKWRKFKRKARLRLQFIQDDLYEIDEVVHPYFRAFDGLLVLLVLVSVLIPIAFQLTPAYELLNNRLEIGLLVGFVTNFGLRLIVTSDRKTYIRKRWFELLLSCFSVLFLVDMAFLSVSLFEGFFPEGIQTNALFLRILKGYLILIVITKALQFLPELLSNQSNSARFLVNSFLLLIASGTFLLMLPGATQDGNGLNFIDALFTSTSAVCVTGLIVVDTATHFTLFGELVILFLIQLGGLGIITFATFLFLFISGGLGVGQMSTLKTFVAESNTSLAVITLKRIVGFTLIIEFIGAVAYFFFWDVKFGNMGERILFSSFHAVSAFCNAGFSLFTNSLADPVNAKNVGVNITTMILIVVGGMGFTVVWELIRRRSERTFKHRKLSVHTKLVLTTTFVLILTGAALFLVMEWENTLEGESNGTKIMLSLFQSITTRTAGFNTVDTGQIGISATLVMLILMFIGGSPASTAGGIKTTTFAVLIRSIVMTVRGYNRMELFKRTIPNSVIFRGVTVVFLAAGVISVSTILLSLVEEHSFLMLLFEEISAFATVGLSKGITAELTGWGKFIIIVSMFLGRVGILTFMVAFAQRVDSHKYRYPEENVMVS